MALLDHQVPDVAKEVTVDLLQKCVGNMCVVKYKNDGSSFFISCGMIASMVVPDDRQIESSKIALYTGATNFDWVDGADITYIYSLSMLPGAVSDMDGLMGPDAGPPA